jgi:hypothetical protein
LQNPVVVSPVVRLFSLSTPAVNSADVDDETMAAIGQEVVAALTHHRVQPLWGAGATGTTWMPMASKTCSAATTSKATQGASATTSWPIAAIVSSSTSAELTAGVDNEKSLTTGETTTGESRGSSGRVPSTGTNTGVAEAPCVALEVVAAEQVFEVIVIPVVPVAPAPQRGWTRWCIRAALAVGNMIVNDGHVFF